MAKVDRVISLLENRIARGDYALRPLPAETRLATEAGVSRMTARKAVLHLLDRGLLARGDNGRLVVNMSGAPLRLDLHAGDGNDPAASAKGATPATHYRSVNVALAAPAHGSTEIDRWRVAADRALAAVGGQLRIVHFHHWDDPILSEAAETFDGLFLLPPAEAIPQNVLEKLRNSRAKVVALDCDLSSLGLRSIDLIPPTSVHSLLDHLASLGHRNIACFNCQPVDSVVEQRIEQWELWCAAQGIDGELINDPDTSYGNPPRHAYESMSRRLAASPLQATAVLCITMPAALGVMRAMYEQGIQVGKQISVCAANDEGLASFLCPSLTSTQMPDPLPYLTVSLEWMSGKPTVSPLLRRPTEVPLFIGESTGPAPVAV